MASSNKRKTTMAKRNREQRLLERRQQKQAKKAARKLVAADGRATDDHVSQPSAAPSPEAPETAPRGRPAEDG